MKKIVLVAVPLLIAIAGCEGAGNHGGAFTGPCSYEPHSTIGPAAKLTLTDYGPPVSVGHIKVAYFNGSKTQLAVTRSTGPTIAVGSGKSHIYLLAAPRGTKSCKLADWGS